MLVVADQQPGRVGRERRLAGSGEPEEDGDALAVARDVRRAVHGEHALERQAVVHHREDRLLDLAGVEAPADQHLHPSRVQHREDAGARAVRLGVGLDGGRVQHERLRLEAFELVVGRVDEERLREERVVRAVRHDAHADPVLRVRAGECVDHVEVLLREERRDLLADPVVVLLRDLVVAAPPDAILGLRLADEVLVLRRAAGEAARVEHDRAGIREAAVAAEERVGVQARGARVAEDAPARLEAVRGQVDVVQLLLGDGYGRPSLGGAQARNPIAPRIR